MARTIADLPADIAGRYPYRSHFLTVNGRRMHYVDEGPADAPPVLLLHGNPTWGYLWRDTIPPLLAAGHRVVVPDQIGFGRSEKPHDHRVQRWTTTPRTSSRCSTGSTCALSRSCATTGAARPASGRS